MSDTTVGGGELQFDTAVPKGGSSPAATGTVMCQSCSHPITSTYYDVSGQSTCAACRTTIGTLMETPSGAGPLLKAALFGVGGGIAGAIVYYAVLALTGYEVGLVAIVIGYMVGYTVRKGAGGGGRRFQVMAVLLTYLAVGLAYTPIAIKGAVDEEKKATAAQASGRKLETETGAEAEPTLSAGLALAGVALLALALPVLVVVGGLPSSLISAAIIFFGMAQAWKMTGKPPLVITGPFRVGAHPAPAA